MEQAHKPFLDQRIGTRYTKPGVDRSSRGKRDEERCAEHVQGEDGEGVGGACVCESLAYIHLDGSSIGHPLRRLNLPRCRGSRLMR